MPVEKGLVGNKVVNALPDTGCNEVVIKQKFVREEQYTGQCGFMLLVDNTVRKALFAIIDINTPYLKGQMKAICLPDVIYYLIIGNVANAAALDKPEQGWTPPLSEPIELLSENEVKTDTKAEEIRQRNSCPKTWFEIMTFIQ